MKIEYYHASKYGNGAKIAEEFKRLMNLKGISVDVCHVKNAQPKQVPRADLYLFSSPGRFGKPIGEMCNFLKKINLSLGTKYALLVTEFAPNANDPERVIMEKGTGKCQQVIPIMNQFLQHKGLVNIAEAKVLVTGIKGPLENEWQSKVGVFASKIPVQLDHS